MRYVETTTIVQTDRNGRLIRRRKTTCVRDLDNGIETITTTRLLPEDEYYTRKSYDNTYRSSMDRIYDAYNECRLNDIWD